MALWSLRAPAYREKERQASLFSQLAPLAVPGASPLADDRVFYACSRGGDEDLMTQSLYVGNEDSTDTSAKSCDELNAHGFALSVRADRCRALMETQMPVEVSRDIHDYPHHTYCR